MNHQPVAPQTESIASHPLLDDLTEPQRQAVTHVEGPLLVLAAAGSGKTRVITRRICYLVLHVGLAPWNILAITFTNKAAGEMRQRVAQTLSPKQARAVTVSTFHSFCASIIREYGEKLGLPPGYSIYDAADQTRAVKQAMEALDISSTNFPPGKILSIISNAKNELLDSAGFQVQANDFYAQTVAKVFSQYEKILRKNKALDFDDLLLKTVQLMRRHPSVLAAMRDKYQYVLIDEYQDTNHAQFVIAHTLAGEHRNLCVTGDPDQSIYSWRGADIRNILEFESQYPEAKVVALEQNYRSTKNILAVADELIAHNLHRKHKSLWTENETGDPIKVVCCYDEQHEAQWVVEQFKLLHDDKHLPWNAMAVFYRVNSLSRVMEDALRKAALPYQIARGTAFYDRKEIKDAVALLRVIANPADEVNLMRIINTPARGISDKTVKAMQAHAAARQMSLLEVMQSPDETGALNPRAVNAVTKFSQSIQSWRRLVQQDGPPSLRNLLERVLDESGLEAYYRNDKNDPESQRIANLGELISSTQQFDDEYEGDAPDTLEPKLDAYLEQISLVSDVDAVDLQQGAITLMTLHAAKGLEFPVVAMVGFEDNMLPHSQSLDDPKKLEEERRLCFVGFTRAQTQLMLTFTRYRTVFGNTQPAMASRFLNELPQERIERTDQSDTDNWLDDMDDGDRRMYSQGAQVRHPRFGLGRVVAVNRISRQTRLRIAFAAAGTKTLIAEYASLDIIS